MHYPFTDSGKELYDEIIKRNQDVTEFVDKAVKEALKKKEEANKEVVE